MGLRARPLTLKTANALVGALHRHHKPVRGHRFSIGAETDDGTLVGAVVVGRPVARGFDPEMRAEVTRLVTDGSPNACSFLYGAAARAAKAMGFDAIHTYVLEDEPGVSLKATGWTIAAVTRGGAWVRPDGASRRDDQPTCPKVRWELHFTHTTRNRRQP